MTNFFSLPPSAGRKPLGKMFRGGMMPATGGSNASLIIFDLRSLKLSLSVGEEVEKELRESLFQILEKRGIDLENRSAIDLSTAVFGIAVE